ncbi:hypothetical protein SBM3_00029 [Synechococcus phage S-BM3]|nr:hypothetical protein SBM3_00029 [Synechococcus phage S-BM3]
MSDAISDYWTKKPTTESSTNWKDVYARQRKDRMQDAIDDYLNDDEVDARRAYEEILSCVDDVINYHKKEYDKAVELKSLMMGHRPLDEME